MTRSVVCTIVTPDYIYMAVALGLSLRRSGSDIAVIAIVIGRCDRFVVADVTFLSLYTLISSFHQASLCYETYRHDNDRLRWTLKPSVLRYMLEVAGYDQALYVDPDCCFFDPPSEIFEDLLGGDIILTPHWRPTSPVGSTARFRTNFLDGLFNAGCVGATLKGVDALLWWGEACLSACRKSRGEGLYDDQRYLDLMPILFEDTRILRHRGYNLAEWNINLRRSCGDGLRDVPERWPVRLVHFTALTKLMISAGDDPVLAPYLARYTALIDEGRASAQRHGQVIHHMEELPSAETVDASYAAGNRWYEGTWKLRLRKGLGSLLARITTRPH